MPLADPSARVVYLDQLGALDHLTARKQSPETELFARVDASAYGLTGARLPCLRGVGQLTTARAGSAHARRRVKRALEDVEKVITGGGACASRDG